MTKLVGEITQEDIDVLEEELGEISTTTKSLYFPQGDVFGHLPLVVPQAKMRTILGDPTYTFTAQPDPGAYNSAAIGTGVNAVIRSQI